MIRCIHTADIHLGVENYGKIDPKTGIHTRLLDFNTAFSACIDAALEHAVDLFIFSGDAYKTTTPTPTQQKLFIKQMLRLYAAHIPAVIIVGNHDNPLSFGKAHSLDIFSELPLEGFYVIKKPELCTIQTKNGPVQVVGIPWPTRTTIALAHDKLEQSASDITRYISSAVSHILDDLTQKVDPALPAILAGHLTVTSGLFSGSERRAIYGNDPVFLPSQLAKPPYDYVALGHLHRHQNLNPNGNIPLVYAGSLERIDFGERDEKKGFCLVSIPGKGKASYQFIPTPTRPFIQLEITLKPETSQTEQILEQLRTHTIDNAIIKIIYHIPPEQKDRVDIPTIQRACAQAHYLVDILPVRHAQQREKRTTIKVDMDLKTALSAYFSTRSVCTTKKDTLIQKTLELAAQAEQE